MVDRKVIIDKLVALIDTKLNEVALSNPMFMVFRPIISRAINNNIGKLDSILKLVQDKNGQIDVEGILSEMTDNLLIAQVKKYSNDIGGLEIGNGSVKIDIPFINKTLVFDSTDIEELKNNLKSV